MVVHIHEALHRGELHSGVAIAERLYLEQHHQPHDIGRQPLAGAARVRHHQIALKLLELVAADRDVAQRTKSGGDAIDRLGGGFNLGVEISAAGGDALHGIARQSQARARCDNLTDTLYGKTVRRYMVYVH